MVPERVIAIATEGFGQRAIERKGGGQHRTVRAVDRQNGKRRRVCKEARDVAQLLNIDISLNGMVIIEMKRVVPVIGIDEKQRDGE